MKAFTLLELLVVVVILAVLAGLAIPQYWGVITRTRESEGWMALAAIRTSELRYYSERSEVFTPNIVDLDIDDPNLPPNRLFNYGINVFGFTVTATATPRAACRGCNTLTLDQNGDRTP